MIDLKEMDGKLCHVRISVEERLDYEDKESYKIIVEFLEGLLRGKTISLDRYDLERMLEDD